MQVAVAGTLRSNNRFGNTADTWQPGGMTVNLNNEFHTHDSLSESEDRKSTRLNSSHQ